MTADRRTHVPPVTTMSAGPHPNAPRSCHLAAGQRARTAAAGGDQTVAPFPARYPSVPASPLPAASTPAPATPGSPGGAAVPNYHSMLAVDIKGFNDQRRDQEIRWSLRMAMYELLASAFSRSGLAWPACYHEDRGDGVLVIAPPAAPAMTLLYPLAEHLRAGIRRHNRFHTELAQIRLRAAVHAGHVCFDSHGVCGDAVNHLFRMLEAPAFKRALDASDADFALVTSGAVFDDVVFSGTGLIDPDMYAPVQIRCKETRAQAWLYLPPVRNPALGGAAGRRPQRASAQLRTMAHAVSRRSGTVGSALAKLSTGRDLPRPA